MANRFYPTEWISSTYRIDFERLYREGYRGLIFDIDNTLVPHGAPADDRAVALFERLRQIGFSLCLLSNNKKKRVDLFNKDINVHAIWMANKPLKAGYIRAMELMETSLRDTVYIGDQLFTDVWGASRMGMFTILVSPINPREEIQIVLKRLIERPVLSAYRKSALFSRAHELSDKNGEEKRSETPGGLPGVSIKENN